jgi:hypothetical protein
MAMSHDDRLSAALQLIQVTPENFKNLNADVITYLYQVVLDAELELKPKSPDEGLSEEEIKERERELR